MPDVVVRHKNSKVAAYVLSVPEGADVEEWVRALPEGWSLDKKTDPADVPVELPAASAAATPKEN